MFRCHGVIVSSLWNVSVKRHKRYVKLFLFLTVYYLVLSQSSYRDEVE